MGGVGEGIKAQATPVRKECALLRKYMYTRVHCTAALIAAVRLRY